MGETFLSVFAGRMGLEAYELGALLAVFLVSAVCGLVGSLVVGNRMAFFSDAMAHCAFAGVALGILITFLIGTPKDREEYEWIIPLVMVLFGAIVGLGIAFVREKTALASDTVIGVAFAGAIGFGAMLLTALEKRRAFSPETFMFGSPLYVQEIDLLYLAIVFVLTWVFLRNRYNDLVLASLNPPLARSRGVNVRLNNYLIILLLALIVNLSIKAVGVLLINAMLIVPAATAGNIARNLRQMFWLTLALSVGAGVIGLQVSYHLALPMGANEEPLRFGPSGTIICLSVLFFFLSMATPILRRKFGRPVRHPTPDPGHSH